MRNLSSAATASTNRLGSNSGRGNLGLGRNRRRVLLTLFGLGSISILFGCRFGEAMRNERMEVVQVHEASTEA
jgi:hypothetical protein